MAISGGFTWSLFPIVSCIFAWLIFFPIIKWGEKGIAGSLIALSVFIVPFLFVLDCLIENNNQIMPIGIKMSIISVAFLWLVFAIFRGIRERTLLAAAISFLCAVPVCIIINISLSKTINKPAIDAWDIMDYLILLIIAAAFFSLDYVTAKREEACGK